MSEYELVRAENILYIPPNREKGFNFGYFLKWQCLKEGAPLRLFGESNNIPFMLGDYEMAKNGAQNSLMLGGQTNNIMTNGFYNYALVYPVFTRPEIEIENGKKSNLDIQALTREAVLSTDKNYQHPDRQFASMIADAKNILHERGLETTDKICMVGFSDSANFAQRFAFLHPELVSGVFIGGMGAMPCLPVDTFKGEKIEYPLGTADYEEITGHEFDFDTYKNIPQYYMLGDQDDNDFTKYRDCFTYEQMDQIARLFGEDMQTTRWDTMNTALKSCGLENIKTFKITGAGHTLQGMYDYKPDFIAELKSREHASTQERSR